MDLSRDRPAVARRRGSRMRGISTVEAALVLPIILLLTFGILEYGWLFLKSQEVAGAARHGARAASLPDASSEEVIESVHEYLRSRGLNDDDVEVSLSAGLGDLNSGDAITLTVRIPDYRQISVTRIRLIPTPGSLSSSTTMAKEGP